MQRADDDVEVVRERLRVYARDTRPIVEFYERRPTFRSVDGDQTQDAVAADIAAAVASVVGRPGVIHLPVDAEIERMRAANQLVADVLAQLEAAVAPGVTTADLDALAERWCARRGAEPAFKGYRGYPATLCASVNEEVVHGIPSTARALQEGDIVSLDMGVKLDGFYGDSAVTVPVGEVPERRRELLRVTRESLERAIAQVRVGGRLSDIGHAVQAWVEAHGFSVVREFVGHGIGEKLHEEPQIPNYGQPGRGPKLAEGMVLAIEPMVAMGRPETRGAGRRLDGGDERRQPGGALRAHGRGDGVRAAGVDGAAASAAPVAAASVASDRSERGDDAASVDGHGAGGAAAGAVPGGGRGGREVIAHARGGAGHGISSGWSSAIG